MVYADIALVNKRKISSGVCTVYCSFGYFYLSDILNYLDARAELAARCKAVLQPPDAKSRFDFAEAVKCAVALGKRPFVLEVLPESALPLVLDRCEASQKPKRKGLFRR